MTIGNGALFIVDGNPNSSRLAFLYSLKCDYRLDGSIIGNYSAFYLINTTCTVKESPTTSNLQQDLEDKVREAEGAESIVFHTVFILTLPSCFTHTFSH